MSSGADTNNKACAYCHAEFPAGTMHCPQDGTTLTEIKRGRLVGTTFAEKYEMIDVVGVGGMGVVYKAKHRLMNRLVAIKVMHNSGNTGTDALKRFRIEAEAASMLSIPNVISIYDFGVSSDGEPYMVMEYVEGTSLKNQLDEQGALSLTRAVPIFSQICSAVAHAHSKGIIHRDLTPANILLMNTEQTRDFVKVLDFGIAKLLDASDPSSTDLTKTGEVFGSPLYISPEQWQGKGFDCRSDIYSMGSIMYRTLTNRAIFPGNDVVEIMRKHITEMPLSFAALGTELPAEVEAIVFKALQKEPEHRFQTMSELMQAIQEISVSANNAFAASKLEVTLPPDAILKPGTLREGTTTTTKLATDGEPRTPRNESLTDRPDSKSKTGSSKKGKLIVGGLTAAIALGAGILFLGRSGHKDTPAVEPIYVNLSKNQGGPSATREQIPISQPTHATSLPLLRNSPGQASTSSQQAGATIDGAPSNIQMGQSHFTAAGQSNFSQAGNGTPAAPMLSAPAPAQSDSGAGIRPFTQAPATIDANSSSSPSASLQQQQQQQQQQRLDHSDQTDRRKTTTKKTAHKSNTKETVQPKHKKEGGLKNAIKNFFKKF